MILIADNYIYSNPSRPEKQVSEKGVETETNEEVEDEEKKPKSEVEEVVTEEPGGESESDEKAVDDNLEETSEPEADEVKEVSTSALVASGPPNEDDRLEKEASKRLEEEKQRRLIDEEAAEKQGLEKEAAEVEKLRVESKRREDEETEKQRLIEEEEEEAENKKEKLAAAAVVGAVAGAGAIAAANRSNESPSGQSELQQKLQAKRRVIEEAETNKQLVEISETPDKVLRDSVSLAASTTTMAEINSLIADNKIPNVKADEMFLQYEGKEDELLMHLRKMNAIKKSGNEGATKVAAAVAAGAVGANIVTADAPSVWSGNTSEEPQSVVSGDGTTSVQSGGDNKSSTVDDVSPQTRDLDTEATDAAPELDIESGLKDKEESEESAPLEVDTEEEEKPIPWWKQKRNIIIMVVILIVLIIAIAVGTSVGGGGDSEKSNEIPGIDEGNESDLIDSETQMPSMQPSLFEPADKNATSSPTTGDSPATLKPTIPEIVATLEPTNTPSKSPITVEPTPSPIEPATLEPTSSAPTIITSSPTVMVGEETTSPTSIVTDDKPATTSAPSVAAGDKTPAPNTTTETLEPTNINTQPDVITNSPTPPQPSVSPTTGSPSISPTMAPTVDCTGLTKKKACLRPRKQTCVWDFESQTCSFPVEPVRD